METAERSVLVGGWCANQEGGGRSGWLTLIIKRSDKLFHGVNEDGELSGFSFRGRSKGQSKRKQTSTGVGTEAAVP